MSGLRNGSRAAARPTKIIGVMFRSVTVARTVKKFDE
jgi:hypothetical protein